jgi:hypothetical protein
VIDTKFLLSRPFTAVTPDRSGTSPLGRFTEIQTLSVRIANKRCVRVISWRFVVLVVRLSASQPRITRNYTKIHESTDVDRVSRNSHGARKNWNHRWTQMNTDKKSSHRWFQIFGALPGIRNGATSFDRNERPIRKVRMMRTIRTIRMEMWYHRSPLRISSQLSS